MLKRLVVILAWMLGLILLLLVLLAFNKSHHVRRDPQVLMNKYYALKATHPAAAEDALRLILEQDPYDIPALTEWSQALVQARAMARALPLLERLHRLLPNNLAYTYQLGYAYYEQGQWTQARALFLTCIHNDAGVWKNKAEQALLAMASFMPFYQDWADYTPIMDAHSLTAGDDATQSRILPSLNQTPVPRSQHSKQSPLALFYALKTHHEEAAWRHIQRVVKHESANAMALEEAGFLALKRGQRAAAIDYFTRAYALTGEPALAMQLGYLYNQENKNRLAYTYFNQATRSTDPILALRAENALTNLVGQQTKALPEPYYAEIFAMPFSQTRFDLTVPQFIGRLGVEQNNRWQTKEYTYIRRTQDNRSANLGQLSQLFEDNVQITGVGVQLNPLPGLPILAFGEMGAAYDLINQNRDRWRSDVRAGLMYYQQYGQPYAYYNHLIIRPDYYSTWYADMTYFSRYNNNVIAVAKTHQGVHAVQYKSSVINLYMRGIVVGDTQREFYNNFAEIGPGIGFIPSNRYNLELRVEYINGMYLPAGASFNPYGKYYTNTIVQLLFYVKI